MRLVKDPAARAELAAAPELLARVQELLWSAGVAAA
jgi:hypothetical protein